MPLAHGFYYALSSTRYKVFSTKGQLEKREYLDLTVRHSPDLSFIFAFRDTWHYLDLMYSSEYLPNVSKSCGPFTGKKHQRVDWYRMVEIKPKCITGLLEKFGQIDRGSFVTALRRMEDDCLEMIEDFWMEPVAVKRGERHFDEGRINDVFQVFRDMQQFLLGATQSGMQVIFAADLSRKPDSYPNAEYWKAD